MKQVIKKIMKLGFTFLACRKIRICKSKPHVNFYSRFTRFTTLGENCHFNGLTIRGKGEVIIGDNFHSGKGCIFINSNHQYNKANAIPYDTHVKIDKKIAIEDNVWIGDKVLILGGVTIGEGAIIQAGSVVSQNIPAFGIAGGNPARVFKYRDIESYKKLKSEKKFC